MHVRRALALSLLTPLLLAGCSDGGEPEADPTPKMPETSSTTPSPSETETVEEESPEEFVRRWQKAADDMVLTGDDASFKALSKDCKPCSTYADQVTEVYRLGGSVTFSGSKVTKVVTESVEPPTLIATVKSGELRIETPGQEPRMFPAATQTYRMILAPSGDSFVMRNYSVL